MFDGIQIGRLRRPRQQRDVVVAEPFGEQLRLVFRVVVLLENEATASSTAEKRPDNSFHDIKVHLRIHLTLNPMKGTNSFATEATVDHHRTSTTLHGRQLVTRMVSGTDRTSHKLDSIRPKQQNFDSSLQMTLRHCRTVQFL
ncbi:hypothetical protein V3C99_004874 [Haemonchus contortus]